MGKNQHDVVFVRALILMLVFIACFLLVMYKVSTIALYEQDKWLAMKDSLYLDYVPIEAERGNILADDGSLLATSIQFFDIRMDFEAGGLTDDAFYSGVDSLAIMLSHYVNPSKSVQEYKSFLIRMREADGGNRYVLLKRDATYEEMKRIMNFPILRRGQNGGGLIVEREAERIQPFGRMGSRTIGIARDNVNNVGLELSYDNALSGEEGKRLVRNVGSGDWLPVNDVSNIKPKRGKDIKTSIDVYIQDITDYALEKQLEYHNADYGVAIVMEVETGKIKAISNLTKTDNGEYAEIYNHAVGTATAPGSTFKAAFLLALMEQGLYDSTEVVDITNGYLRVCDEDVHDASAHAHDKVTIDRAFEISSNIGMIRLALEYFAENEKAFINQLRKFRLDKKTGIGIIGEADPYIKDYEHKERDHWSCTTVPWMAMGYELAITPLQLLTFYNAIANGGTMMQPYLVTAIQQDGRVKKTFQPTVLKERIASQANIGKMQELLEGVVLRGTASRLRTDKYTFAGKTGTCNLALNKVEKSIYQASFAGYFPAEDPIYSIIVVVYNPRRNGYYGSSVAGPVFREITDKIYASMIDLDIEKRKDNSVVWEPEIKGNITDVNAMYAALDIELNQHNDAEWVDIETEGGDTIILQPLHVTQEKVPDVRGMALKDALYILENMNLQVHFKGTGKVVRQSISPGTENVGQEIKLILG